MNATPTASPAARLALLALAVACLALGIAGGLVRLGWPAGDARAAAASHGALMIGFLGTVISLERAVALGSSLALAAPLASGAGALLLLAGWTSPAIASWLLAPVLLFTATATIVRRQAEAHTVLLLVASAAWAAGNALHVLSAPPDATAAWWFAFLVLTIGAERLEMTRLMKRRAAAKPLLYAAIAWLVAGAIVSVFERLLGAALYGSALVALAAWLVAFDIARRTVRTEGFAQYAAVGLLTGYVWLAIAGIAWALRPHYGAMLRDAALHALGLGFIFSMIFAHAPLVIPVIARLRMRYTPWFYLPLAMLHVSLAMRLGPGLDAGPARQWGGIFNAVTIAFFATTLVASLRSTGTSRNARGSP